MNSTNYIVFIGVELVFGIIMIVMMINLRLKVSELFN